MYILRPQYPPPPGVQQSHCLDLTVLTNIYIILQQDMNHDRYLVPHMYYRPRVYSLFGVSHFELGWFSLKKMRTQRSKPTTAG